MFLKHLERVNFWLLFTIIPAGIALGTFGLNRHVQTDPPGRSFYVSPCGHPGATGTLDHPWDLATALAQPQAVQPGDKIWLRGGTYHGTFTSLLKGAPERPVIVRQFAQERVTIDTGTASSGAGLTVRGADTWYWGIEVMSSSPQRTTDQPGPAPTNLSRVPGVEAFGPRTKFINMIVHDTAGGYGFWTPAVDSEIYGNLIYYNGWRAPDRGHGHGIYIQNRTGKKRIEDNIQFADFGMGIRAYGTEAADARNIEIIGNVSINSGELADGVSHWANFFFTVGLGADNILLEDNHSYHTPGLNAGSSNLGWAFSSVEKHVVARRNYFIGGASAVEIWNWNNVIFEDNTVYSDDSLMLLLHRREDQHSLPYVIRGNTYYGSGLLRLDAHNLRWPQWLEQSNFDTNSTFTSGRPKGTWVFIRHNRYDAGRAHIIVYNWGLQNSVSLDLSSVLETGAAYEIRDAQNYFGPPVVQGTYMGEKIVLQMIGNKPAMPVGTSPPAHTAPEFGTFVIVSKLSTGSSVSPVGLCD